MTQITPIEAFGILVIGGFLYFLPGFIAIFRYHRSVRAIFLLLVLFGFTGIGWLIALVWSLSGHADTDVKRLRRAALERQKMERRENRKREKAQRREDRRKKRQGDVSAGKLTAVDARSAVGTALAPASDPLAAARQVWSQAGSGGEPKVEESTPVQEIRASLVHLVEERGQGAVPGAASPSDETEPMVADQARTQLVEVDEVPRQDPEDSANEASPSDSSGSTDQGRARLAELAGEEAMAARRCPRCREHVTPIDNYCPVCGKNFAM